MNIIEYKETIKKLVDATDNEILLKHWKRQLEQDVADVSEIELSDEEWNLAEEGVADYNNGNIISLEEFIGKRK